MHGRSSSPPNTSLKATDRYRTPSLSGETPAERHATMRLKAATAGEDELRDVYERVGYRMRKVLCKALTRTRPEIVEKLIKGSSDQLQLLLFCSSDYLLSAPPSLILSLTKSQLLRLMKTSPPIVYRYMEFSIKERGAEDKRHAPLMKLLIDKAGRREEKRVETLARALSVHHHPNTLFSYEGKNKHVDLYIQLIDAAVMPAPSSFAGCNISKMKDETFAKLYGERGKAWSWNWPNTVTMRKRYDHYYPRLQEEWRSPNGLLPDWYLRRLSPSIQVKEARRALRLPVAIQDPSYAIPYVPFLPLQEAREKIEHYIRGRSEELRGSAVSAYGYLCVRHPELLSDFLRTGLTCQQPPRLRYSLFRALDEIPAEYFESDQVSLLNDIIATAWESADMDNDTCYLVENLACKLHERWPTEAVAWLLRTASRNVPHRSLHHPAFTRQVIEVISVFWVERMHKNMNRWMEIAENAIGMLKHRLIELPKFVEEICSAIRHEATDNSGWKRDTIVEDLGRYDKLHFEALARSIVKDDLSWLTIPGFAVCVLKTEPELFDGWAGANGAPQGRWNPLSFFFCPPIPHHRLKYLPHQQQCIWNRILTHFCLEKPRPSSMVAAVLTSVGHLDSVPYKDSLLLAAMEGRLRIEDTPSINCRDFAARLIIRGGRMSGLQVLEEVGLPEEKGRWLELAARYRLQRACLEKRLPLDIRERFKVAQDGDLRAVIRSLRPTINHPDTHLVLLDLLKECDGNPKVLKELLLLTMKRKVPLNKNTEEAMATIVRFGLTNSDEEVRTFALSSISKFESISFSKEIVGIITQNPTSASLFAACMFLSTTSAQLKLMTVDGIKSLTSLVLDDASRLLHFVTCLRKRIYEDPPLRHYNHLTSAILEQLSSDCCKSSFPLQVSLVFAISDVGSLFRELQSLAARLDEETADIYYARVGDIVMAAHQRRPLSSEIIPLLIGTGSTALVFAAYFILCVCEDLETSSIISNAKKMFMLEAIRSSHKVWLTVMCDKLGAPEAGIENASPR